MVPFENYKGNGAFVVNTLAGTIFTTLHFLSKLQTDPKRLEHSARKVGQEPTF
jgi:hypothetical protein